MISWVSKSVKGNVRLDFPQFSEGEFGFFRDEGHFSKKW